ncbi:uncharacterized protein LOC121381593 [Gigantopelta aegis]|uniref:uncharacterized protein LOC121381593 n=1 Tax=Gigantopelta aegis TaxID=1735272 RepID=UPI001B88AD46|nr:uncharacterized protein LOC121381593 [Gigantopelta aegis]
MRVSQWTKGQRTGYQRVNDQIVDYLQAARIAPSPGVTRAGYIAIGQDLGQRSAARQVAALNSNLNLVANAIMTVTHQNRGIFWNQVTLSLPSLLTSQSKVVIITATQPSDIERLAVSTMIRNLNAEVFVIGLPFKEVLSSSALQSLATSTANVRVLNTFDDFSIRNQLEQFIPVTCAVVDKDCSRCDYQNGAAYIGDDNNCHRFYFCEYKLGSDQPTKHSFVCPWTTVWDQEKLTCIHEDATNGCPYCDAPNEYGKYSVSSNCRQYRVCNGTQPYVDKCCPLGQRFDKASLTCVTDRQCQDTCGDDGRSFSCNKYPMTNDICKYQIREPGHPVYNKSCAEGTKFSREHCLCVWLLAGESCATDPRDFNGCLWTVELPFTDGANGLQTRGQNGVTKGPVFTQSSYLSSEKVLVNSVAREGVFRKGYLKSWYFSYRNWQPNLLVKLKFKEDSSNNEEQVILSNVCCDTSSDEPSVFIYVNPATGQLRGGVKTETEGMVTAEIRYNVAQSRDMWKEVTLQRAGGELKMKLTIDGTAFAQTTQGVPAMGEIVISKCSLKLGGPGYAGKSTFRGKMSSFYLSNECDVIPAPELI